MPKNDVHNDRAAVDVRINIELYRISLPGVGVGECGFTGTSIAEAKHHATS